MKKLKFGKKKLGKGLMVTGITIMVAAGVGALFSGVKEARDNDDYNDDNYDDNNVCEETINEDEIVITFEEKNEEKDVE